MAKLTSEQQLFLVDERAMWSTPTEAARNFEERFGVALNRAQVAKYDPAGAAGVEMSQRLKDRFAARRKQFVEEIDGIPIANKAYRIHKLGRMFLEAEKQGNRTQAAALLEQAAKETGGSFTNKLEVKHKGKIAGDAMTPEQQRMALVDAISGAMEKAGARA